MRASQTRPFAIPKAPSSIKLSRGVIDAPVRALPPVSTQKLPPRNRTQVISGSKGQGRNTNSPAKNLSEPKPTPSTPQQTKEHILSQGECGIINEPENSSVSAKFILKVQVQRNEGLLIFVPSGKLESAYNVLSLGIPVIQGPFCIIYGARNERLYKLKLRTASAAESFQYLLKSLQQSALQFGEPKLVSLKSTPIPAAQKEQAASPLQTPCKATLKTSEGAPGAVDGDARNTLQTPDSIEASLQPESEESLLNLEDDSSPKPSLTIEAAADHMQQIVQQILSEITATGVKVPEKGVEEIESTAIANWMAQGFMKSETESDELKDELVELLRLLVRIKRKVQYRHGSNAGNNVVSISSATLQDLQEIAEKPSKRIKYTTADIKELETHAVSRQNKIKASGLQEIQKSSPVPGGPKKKAVPSMDMAKHRA